MNYKGYSAKVEFDDESNIFHGRVIGIGDVINFEADTVSDLINAFHDSVDDYLAWCKERGERPNKEYSGKFVLRLPKDLHAKLAIKAETLGVSLNDLIVKTLTQEKEDNLESIELRRSIGVFKEMVWGYSKRIPQPTSGFSSIVPDYRLSPIDNKTSSNRYDVFNNLTHNLGIVPESEVVNG